jgi:branched-chain amino acid transport system permease protein
MNYLVQTAETFCIYAMLGVTLNLVLGYTGLLSLAHAAFFGLGAYVAALLMVDLGWTFLPATAAAMAINGGAALALAIPSVRLRGDYFVLGTVAFHMIIFVALYNLVDLTRGPYGVTGIPRPAIAGWEIDSREGVLVLTLILLLIVTIVHWQLCRSPYGRALRAVRDDEIVVKSLGKNVTLLRSSAFAVSGALAAVPGAAFVAYYGYLHPASFTLDVGVLVVTLVVVGGSGTLRGPLAGALFVALLPELLRFLPVTGAGRADLQQILLGLLLVLAMRFRPQGLAGAYRYD